MPKGHAASWPPAVAVGSQRGLPPLQATHLPSEGSGNKVTQDWEGHADKRIQLRKGHMEEMERAKYGGKGMGLPSSLQLSHPPSTFICPPTWNFS